MTPAASDIAREVDSAFWWIGGICVVFLIGVTAAMIAFVIKYHRSRRPKAVQIEGHLPLEITWIVIPTILVMFMFFKGYQGFAMMRSVPEGAQVVKVTAQRWFWTFTYPGLDISSGELVVPVNTPIKLEMTAPANDVVHSLYLPAFRVKEDCVPGKNSYLWFNADNIGTYNIFCAEYCGKDHSKMLSRLIVLAPEDYQAWLTRTLEEKNQPVDMALAMDPQSAEVLARDADGLFATYCVSCHGANGKGGLVENARNFTSLDGWKRSPKITDIYRTLQLGIDGTQMRPFTNLPPWDRFALAHKVASFYQGADRPRSTPEEIEALRAEYRLDEKVEPRRTIPIEDAMRARAAEAGVEEGK